MFNSLRFLRFVQILTGWVETLLPHHFFERLKENKGDFPSGLRQKGLCIFRHRHTGTQTQTQTNRSLTEGLRHVVQLVLRATDQHHGETSPGQLEQNKPLLPPDIAGTEHLQD